MQRDIKIKLSWYSPENLSVLIREGYLPVFAMPQPPRYKDTPVHFPQLAPRRDYRRYLEESVGPGKILNSLNILAHVSCAPEGVVILTGEEDIEGREILGDFLRRYYQGEVSEYEYDRD